MENSLKECPFCGCNKTDEGSVKYFCRECGASVDKNLWNTRHSPWISIENELPEVEQNVLCLTKCKNMYIAYLHDDGNFYINCHMDIKISYPNYWMPLPQPPKEITNE